MNRATVAVILMLSVRVAYGQTRRRAHASDLPSSWTSSASEFDRFVAQIDQQSKNRLRDGENDHVIAYVLQSARFTRQPSSVPALSALEFVQAMPSAAGCFKADERFSRSAPQAEY